MITFADVPTDKPHPDFDKKKIVWAKKRGVYADVYGTSLFICIYIII